MDFTPKRVSETEIFTVDYTGNLADGETIVSATWSSSARNAADPSPNSMISGSASISGSQVSIKLTGGIAWVTYYPICAAVTSLGQTLILPDRGSGALKVLPDA